MNNWKKVKLGSILTESKIEAVESNADSRIRVLLNANGVIKRPLTKETKGATKYFKRSEGQFIYGKQNLHKGAFGIIPKELDGFTSSSDLPAFDVDESCLPEWLDYFLKQGDFYLSLIDIAKGAATKRIQPKALFEVEIPLPDTIQEQQEIIEGFKNKERYNEFLDSEIQTQKQLISQLKQAILQEAIQGRLTQEWREQNPNTEPASELLERIKAEKEQLIKDKKIKKEKPLPAITEDEIPFEIPEGWVCCRLGEIGLINPKNEIINNPKSSFIPMTLISEKFGVSPSFEIKNWEDIKKGYTHFAENDVGFAKITPCFENSKAAIFSKLKNGIGAGTTELHIFRSLPKNKIESTFIYSILKSPEFLKSGESLMTGTAGQKRVPKEYFTNKVIGLPPIEEQKAIVEKVETLMKKCSALEQEITQSEQHANMLMQAVLKEAFESKVIDN